MTEVEYNRLKRIQSAMAVEQKRLAARALKAEKRFSSVQKGIADLLMILNRRIPERDSRKRPPLNEI